MTIKELEEITKFRVEVKDHVATVTIAAPPVNSQDRRFREECIKIFDVLGAEVGVRAIVLTGDGKTFSAGADLFGTAGASERAWRLFAPQSTRSRLVRLRDGMPQTGDRRRQRRALLAPDVCSRSSATLLWSPRRHSCR